MISSKEVMNKLLPLMILGIMVEVLLFKYLPHEKWAAILMSYSFGVYCMLLLWFVSFYKKHE